MEIILVRHTTPDIAKGICYGQSDIPVTDTFHKELEQIKTALANYKFDAIYSSPLIRCKHLAESLGTTIMFDDRLLELNFGDWELKNWNDIPKEDLDYWMENFVTIPATNGESYQDLQQRTTRFLNEIAQLNHKTVLIVTHAGVIRSLWAYNSETPLENSFDLKLSYGEILKLTI